MLGCAIVLLLAHGFVVERYVITAAAATVMALLQAHLVAPISGFAIGERLADTMLGAVLAWALSYVLPVWERRSLPQAIARALQALRDFTGSALRTDADCMVAQRLARRRAYDALGVLATALERSAVEPARVRPPERELALLLDRGHRLMAHLSLIRLMLTQRGAELDRPEAAAALDAAKRALTAALTLDSSADLPPSTLGAPAQDMLPVEPPARDVLPWLLWRLRVTVHDGVEAARAAASALARLAEREAATPKVH